MNKEHLKVKETVTMVDKIAAVNEIVNAYFTEDENTGEVRYTPYFAEIANVMVYFTYFTEGLVFEDKEDSIREIAADKELMDWYQAHVCKNYNVEFQEVLGYVDDIVDFKKQQLIHKSPLDELFGTVNRIAKSYEQNMNMEELMSFVKKLGSMADITPESLVDLYKTDKFDE